MFDGYDNAKTRRRDAQRPTGFLVVVLLIVAALVVAVVAFMQTNTPRSQLASTPSPAPRVVVAEPASAPTPVEVFSAPDVVERNVPTSPPTPKPKPSDPPAPTRPKSSPNLDLAREAIRHTWQGYEKFAWGRDSLRPVSMSGEDNFRLLLTAVDGADTILLAGMTEEFQKVVALVKDKLRPAGPTRVNFFETTIRVLGGLLSMYHLNPAGEDPDLLMLAADLGWRLSGAFETPTGIPRSDINLNARQGFNPPGIQSSTAEATTVQLEFRALGHAVATSSKPIDYTAGLMDLKTDKGRKAFATTLERFCDQSMTAVMEAAKKRGSGLVPFHINPDTAGFTGNTITLGARGDSYYEYLLKQYLHLRHHSPTLAQEYLGRFIQAHEEISKTLVVDVEVETGEPAAIVAEKHGGSQLDLKVDHLTCFYPGIIALAVNMSLLPNKDRELDLAAKLTRGCVAMYDLSATKLAGEITKFDWAGPRGARPHITPPDGFSLLRPETAESLYVMFSVTRDDKYRRWGARMLESFNTYARVESGGYASLDNVESSSPVKRDSMESFFLSETLKYLYLLFSDEELVSHQNYVFNTEAHPLPVLPPPLAPA